MLMNEIETYGAFYTLANFGSPNTEYKNTFNKINAGLLYKTKNDSQT